jgi:hypothetical protein
MHALYFIILLCLIPNDFTHQGESVATQWVKMAIFSSKILMLYQWYNVVYIL